jgi:hypothetical protein
LALLNITPSFDGFEPSEPTDISAMTTPVDHAKAQLSPAKIEAGVRAFINFPADMSLSSRHIAFGRSEKTIADLVTEIWNAMCAYDAAHREPSAPTEQKGGDADGLDGRHSPGAIGSTGPAPSSPEERFSVDTSPGVKAGAINPPASIEAMASELAESMIGSSWYPDNHQKIIAFAARVTAEHREKFREAVDVAEWLSRKWGDPNGTVEQQAVWDHSMNRILPRLRAAIRQCGPSEGK